MNMFRLCFMLCISLIICMNFCSAKATFYVGEEAPIGDRHHYIAIVGQGGQYDGHDISMTITKNCIVYPGMDDRYYYSIGFAQRKNDMFLFEIKKIIIASEHSSVVINTYGNQNRIVENNVVNDDIECENDPGEINRVILDTKLAMVIRVISNTDQRYDFYPSREFIEYAKKVAQWSK